MTQMSTTIPANTIPQRKTPKKGTRRCHQALDCCACFFDGLAEDAYTTEAL